VFFDDQRKTVSAHWVTWRPVTCRARRLDRSRSC
jgi:hypothetical protein